MAIKNLKEKLAKNLIARSAEDIAAENWRSENHHWLAKSGEIAFNVLEALDAYGWSQKQLAEKLGVSPQQVNKIIQGHENLTLSTISKLEQVLGISLIEIVRENLSSEAMKLAEEKVAYRPFAAQSKKSIISKIKQFFDRDGRVRKAWVFGSFARGDDNPTSDIDIMIEEDSNIKFSYFDLADIQYQLEQRTQHKVDIGFAKSLKPHAEPHIKKEAILIYEKS